MEGPCARALMDFDELKEELRQAYRDGDLTVQEYLAELKALREDSTKEKKREKSSSPSRSDGAGHVAGGSAGR